MAGKRKRLTLSEFKAWLDGVEELQESTWTPTGAQWKLIRTKILNIKETTQHKPVQSSGVPAHYQVTAQRPMMLSPPPPVGGLPADVTIDGTTTAAQSMLASRDGVTSVTPSIDTSDGQYSSAFD